MTLTGGPADKKGNRYENQWVVLKMLEVLNDEALYLRLEPQEEGIDFELKKADVTEYYQVKKPLTNKFNWTMRDLVESLILTRFKRHLERPATKCILASGTDSELRDLIESAKDSITYEEFSNLFLYDKLTQKRLTLYNKFESLVDVWQCERPTALDYLRRLDVDVLTERRLRETTESLLQRAVHGNPSTAHALLRSFAWDNVHAKITAIDIETYLNSVQIRLKRYRNDPKVRELVETINKRFLRQYPCNGSTGTIARDDAANICTLLTKDGLSNGVLITGEAAVGKSCTTLQVIERLQKKNWPFLAFRIDNKKPTELPEKLGAQLGLSESPAITLANIAQNRNCVLIVDQLDTVSEFSGRYPDFFWCIDEIIKQAQDLRVHVLLTCRESDVRYDERLRDLSNQSQIRTINIQPLDADAILNVLNKLGYDQVPTAAQLEILGFPLCLHLLAEITEMTGPDMEHRRELDFTTMTGLFDKFWEHKRAVIGTRLLHGEESQWSDVMRTLCQHMSENRVLFAPIKILDKYSQKFIKALVSERVLLFDEKQYAFFHQSFFDYVFARFFPDDLSLLTFLGGKNEQHLFRRAQIEQLLRYDRDIYVANRSSKYVDRLHILLVSPDVRPHLKQVALALLSDVKAPCAEEWEAVKDFAEHEQLNIWRFFFKKVPWFDLLLHKGVFADYLSRGNNWTIQQIIILFSLVQQQRADEIAELLEPFASAGGQWSAHFRYLLRNSDLGSGLRFFSLFLREIDEGTLDEPGELKVSDFFWDKLHELDKKQPKMACEAIKHCLKRCVFLSVTKGKRNPFTGINDLSFLERRLGMPLSCAVTLPKEFVAAALPSMITLIEAASIKQGALPWADEIWHYGDFEELADIPSVLLRSLDRALTSLAVSEPSLIRTLFDRPSFTKFRTLLFLVIHTYAANGMEFANEAIRLLCDNPILLDTLPVATTRQLLAAATPHCSKSTLAQFEHMLLNYHPPWEARQKDRLWGSSQYALLEAIEKTRRQPAVTRRLEQLKKKFGSDSQMWEQPRAVGGQVKSPISEVDARRLTDAEWVDAINTHNRNSDLRWQNDGPYGGAFELSRVLEEEVKHNPNRFAQLALKLPINANPVYFAAILRGLAQTDLDCESKLEVCLYCHQLPNRPCGSEIADVLSDFEGCAISQIVVEILSWYALNDPNPAKEMWAERAGADNFYFGGDILTAGLNSVRGKAAYAIAKILHHHPSTMSFFEAKQMSGNDTSILEQMVRDPCVEVRAWVANVLLSIMETDQDLAASLFHKLVETREAIFTTHFVQILLRRLVNISFDQRIRGLLEQLVRSQSADVAEVGSHLACWISIFISEKYALADLCISGTSIQRSAAAEVFAANLEQLAQGSAGEQALIDYFGDPVKEVRAKASMCFMNVASNTLQHHTRLIDEFLKSPAFKENCSILIQSLQALTISDPSLIYRICNIFLETFGSEVNDYTKVAFGDIDLVTRLIMRGYRQSTRDLNLASQYLDLVDQMVLLGVYGLDTHLSLFDR